MNRSYYPVQDNTYVAICYTSRCCLRPAACSHRVVLLFCSVVTGRCFVGVVSLNGLYRLSQNISTLNRSLFVRERKISQSSMQRQWPSIAVVFVCSPIRLRWPEQTAMIVIICWCTVHRVTYRYIRTVMASIRYRTVIGSVTSAIEIRTKRNRSFRLSV